MKFIDIHNHLAWDIDDGIESKEKAIIALKKAKNDGIEKIIATPHFIPGIHNNEKVEQMNNRIKELQVLAKEVHIDVYFGCEIFLNSDFLDMIDENIFNTLAGSGYTLCEFDVRKDMNYNDYAEENLYEFEVRNLIPVIAHVERYFPNGIDLKRVENWKDKGYVIQINRTSLLGFHGETVKKNAWKLMRSGLVHVIASDAHREKGNRICKLSDVYYETVKEIGKSNAELLFYKNPLHLIENEEIEDMKIEKKKFSFFNFLKDRNSI